MEQDKRKNDSEMLVALTEIRSDTKHIAKRLDKINGSIEDYWVTKEKLNNACLAIEKINEKLGTEVEPAIVSMKVKFYTAIVTVGLFSGAIGSAVGAAVIRFAQG